MNFKDLISYHMNLRGVSEAHLPYSVAHPGARGGKGQANTSVDQLVSGYFSIGIRVSLPTKPSVQSAV
jgi:hypothetical protein